ncbi:MAG: radical SAM-associated putative lipoprotein [Candidatus Sabulitectum sp.]|nr:radical SAM-associated putative lipoprotein [Candidatus Sabulitectum sp.]
MSASVDEAVRKGQIVYLRSFGKLFASVLSLLGILSGCSMAPDYGVPSVEVRIDGQIRSAEDSSYVQGIQVRLSSPDSSFDYSEYTTIWNGSYELFMGSEYFPWPDSVRLTATDIDGTENGFFEGKDTLLFLESHMEFISFDVDFYLQSAGE